MGLKAPKINGENIWKCAFSQSVTNNGSNVKLGCQFTTEKGVELVSARNNLLKATRLERDGEAIAIVHVHVHA